VTLAAAIDVPCFVLVVEDCAVCVRLVGARISKPSP